MITLKYIYKECRSDDKHTEITHTLHCDSGADDVVEAMYNFMIAIGFHPNTVASHFYSKGDEMLPKDDETQNNEDNNDM